MKNHLRSILFPTALLFGAFASLSAQSKSDLTIMIEALKLRSEVAGSVATGAERIEAALLRLKAHAAPSGLKFAADANFALAAIDVGRRLIATGKPVEAEKFFQAAEESLVAELKKNPQADSRDKAQFLRELALIRGQYLNRAAQAKVDIEAAIALQPDDRELPRIQATLASGNAEHFKDQAGR